MMVLAKVPTAATSFVSSTSRSRVRDAIPRRYGHIRRCGSYSPTLNKHVRLMALDNSQVPSLDPSYAASATMSSLAPSGISPVQEFEPVLNEQAAASFVIIAVVFTLLQLRINAVSNAAKRRSLALEELRKVESLQLSASDVGVDASDRPDEEQVAQAKFEYENALKEELGLRTIVPGVRIVAPNDPKRDEEERAAAKRFLGWGSEEFGDDDTENDVDKDNNILGLDGNQKRNQKGESGNAGLSEISKLVLFGVASMLIVLLWTLSFDPMVADQVFTTVGGSAPSGMPLTSW